MAEPAARGLRWVALTALALQLVAGAWLALPMAGRWLVEAREARKLGHEASRSRIFGEYAWGLEQAERAIPPGDPYLLINEDLGGWYLVLQGDLAPRRALALGGHERSLPSHWRTHGPPGDAPAWVVLFRGVDARPVLVPTEEYLARWLREP